MMNRYVRKMFLTVVFTACIAFNSASAATFPAMTAFDLNDKPFVFPSDIRGNPFVAVLAFSEAQGDEADRVLAIIAELAKTKTSIGYAGFPVIDNPGMIGRAFIDYSMSSDIERKEDRANIVTLYVERDDWLKAIEHTDVTQPYVVVLSSKGEIAQKAPSVEIKNVSDLKQWLKL